MIVEKLPKYTSKNHTWFCIPFNRLGTSTLNLFPLIQVFGLGLVWLVCLFLNWSVWVMAYH